ncbi:high mobility group protein 20A-like [Acropora millepora]|uniref:high mobility group protein 20A-like n=1 Tax=Acropora millepora TaxID=45264 RepID=UPI001CF5BED0|nr:high mobility group protein 20A-like [Acropora millepora]
METRPNDVSGKKNKPRLTDKERSSAESIPSGSSNKQELRKTRGKKRKRSDTDLNAPKAPLPADDRFLNERHENIFPGRPHKCHVEEAEKERYTKELDKNRQNDANGNSVGRGKALKKGEFPSLCDQRCVYKILRILGLKYG